MSGLGIFFSNSVLPQTEVPSGRTLEGLSEQVKRRFNRSDVGNHSIGHYRSARSPGSEEVLTFPLIDLRDVFSKSLFHYVSSGPGEPVVLKSFAFENGLLRMELSRSGGRKGTIWLDVAAKSLMRAVENGKQVHP